LVFPPCVGKSRHPFDKERMACISYTRRPRRMGRIFFTNFFFISKQALRGDFFVLRSLA
jgi:hypothetical protein